VLRNEFEYSQHALDQSALRDISVPDLREAVANAELIEDYPNHKYGPSCLLLGFTARGRPLHIQTSYPSRHRLKVITHTNRTQVSGSNSAGGGTRDDEPRR
jgi:hypothetical protein